MRNYMKHLFIFLVAVFTVSCAQKKDEYENDNTREAASIIGVGETQNHFLEPAGDRDWIMFVSPKANRYKFKIKKSSAKIDGEIVVQKGLLPPIKLANFKVENGDFATDLTPDDVGVTYFIGISPMGNSTGSYSISVEDSYEEVSIDANELVKEESSKLQSYVAYDFESFDNDEIVDQSTDGTRAGRIDGKGPSFMNSPHGRGKAASFNGQWRIVVENSTSKDFSLEGNWTMAFSIYYKKNSNFGNGMITRLTSNSGYCGYRGFFLLTEVDKNAQGFSFSSFDDSYIPDRPWPCNLSLYALQPNKWNRVVIVHKSNQTGDIYINGEKVAEDECMSIKEKGGKKLSIGGNYFNDHCYGDAFASGVQIDDFVIIKKALNEKTIAGDSLTNPLGF